MSVTIIHDALKKILGARSGADLIGLSKRFTLVGGTRSKYNNLRVMYNETIYDSLSEAYYAFKLDELIDKGVIRNYTRQINYPLEGRRGARKLAYRADFVVTGSTGIEYIIDIKGRLLPEANIKLAYFEYVYKTPVHIVMTTGADKFDTSFLK